MTSRVERAAASAVDHDGSVHTKVKRPQSLTASVHIDDDDYTVRGVVSEDALNKLVMLNDGTGASLGILAPPSSVLRLSVP